LLFRDNTRHLRDILEAIDLIELFVHDMTFESYQTDLKTKSAVERQMQIMTEAAIRLAGDAERIAPGPDWEGFRAVGRSLSPETLPYFSTLSLKRYLVSIHYSSVESTTVSGYLKAKQKVSSKFVARASREFFFAHSSPELLSIEMHAPAPRSSSSRATHLPFEVATIS
jgi:hypothetical protein